MLRRAVTVVSGFVACVMVVVSVAARPEAFAEDGSVLSAADMQSVFGDFANQSCQVIVPCTLGTLQGSGGNQCCICGQGQGTVGSCCNDPADFDQTGCIPIYTETPVNQQPCGSTTDQYCTAGGQWFDPSSVCAGAHCEATGALTISGLCGSPDLVPSATGNICPRRAYPTDF
jgi:hypothetical protein